MPRTNPEPVAPSRTGAAPALPEAPVQTPAPEPPIAPESSADGAAMADAQFHPPQA